MYPPSDHLPPTFVRDWRQLLHNKAYIVLMLLIYVIAWLILLSYDWDGIRGMMAQMEQLARCACCDEDMGGDADVYYEHIRFTVERRVFSFNVWHALCAMGLMSLVIPLRVGNALSVDTRVKGTNFLQVTPLSSWRIVAGMWLSAFSQVLLVAALAVPLILARGAMMPMGAGADWYGLFYLVLAGGIFSAAFMFISGLPHLLRYSFLGLFVLVGGSLTIGACHAPEFTPSAVPVWLLGVHVLAAGLIVLLFLQLARRPYAAPAENTALPLRLSALACLGVASFCILGWWDAMYRGVLGVEVPVYAYKAPAMCLVFVAFAGALMDACLPLVALPVHAKRTLRWLPVWPQMPGLLQAGLFLLLPVSWLAVMLCFLDDALREKMVLEYLFASGAYTEALVYACVALTLLMWVPVALSICIGDVLVRRASKRRPLVMGVSFVCLVVSCFAICVSPAMQEVVPVVNFMEAWYKWHNFINLFVDYNVYKIVPAECLPMEDIAEATDAYVRLLSIAAIEAALVVLLLVLLDRRGRPMGPYQARKPQSMPGDGLLQVADLTRDFGVVRAVDDISFSLAAGSSIGLIGANGAGKTTAMRILTTLDLPDSGSVVFGGMDAVAYPEKVRSRIGWMPDFLDPIGLTTVEEYIDFYARAYGLKAAKRRQEVERVLEFCKIADLRARFINKLSKGQTQRVNMARMLIGAPELLIMDEPAAGLDPQSRIEFKQMVRELQKEGKTLLISSHILSELAEMCDSMIFMDKGRIIRQGAQSELVQAPSAGVTLNIRVSGQADALKQWVAAREGWSRLQEKGGGLFTADFAKPDDASLAAELRDLVQHAPVVEFSRHVRNLEEAFVDILHENRG